MLKKIIQIKIEKIIIIIVLVKQMIYTLLNIIVISIYGDYIKYIYMNNNNNA